ncbi:hypothetical protein CEQ90_08465 [Lewinellaceae bacterium SD302]|nr:hypothetical protein CEQ90_08465 [Lewinellaceae bacterium SD302]
MDYQSSNASSRRRRRNGRRRFRCERIISPKAKFYKSLRAYLISLLVLFSAGVLLDNDFFEIFRMVGFWWGIFLAVKYIKLRGLPGGKGWLSDDWFDWILNRHPVEDSILPGNDQRGNGSEPGEDYDPLWKDKDLV